MEELQTGFGFPNSKKYSVKLVSDRGHNTTITIETEEELSPQEIINLLEEIKYNLGVYIYSKDVWG